MDTKIKNYIGWVLTVVLIAAGYGILSYVNTYSKIAEPGTFRSFSVSGEGKVVAIPDVAQFSFSVITQGGKKLDELQKENTDRVNRSIGVARTAGVEDKDIKTDSYSVEPRYQHYDCRIDYTTPPYTGNRVCPPAEIVGYTISQTVTVKVRDFDKIGEIISGVVSSGANSVSQLNFTIDDPAEVESEARSEAIAQATEKAKAVAKAGGFRLGKLLSIEEGYYPYPIYAKYGMGGAVESAVSYDAAAPMPAIEPGSQEVAINVVLRYEIK